MTQKIDLGNVRGKTGQKGKDGIGIKSIERTGRDGLIDTYTITYTNDETSTFTVQSIDSAELVDGFLENDNSLDDKVPSVKAVRTALLQKVGSDYAYSKEASDERYIQTSDVGETVSPTTHTHGKLQSDGKIDTSNNANKNVVTDSQGNITLESKPTIDTSMSASSTRAVQNKVIKSYVDSQVFEAQTNNQITIETELLEDSTNPVQSNAIYSALENGLDTHTHTKSDITDISFGTTSGTFAEGNDGRFTDSRNPKPNSIDASSSVDLNTYTQPAFYYQKNNNNSANVIHKPLDVNRAFTLLVEKQTNQGVKQTFTYYSMDSPQTFIRVKHDSNTTWSEWEEISFVGHTHTRSEITNFSHNHNQITSDGKIGSVADLPLITTTNGVITVGSFGGDTSEDSNKFVSCADARLRDARTPLPHISDNKDTYGASTRVNYGHCKIINSLTKNAYEDGEVLSAYQGKILDSKISLKAPTNHSSTEKTYGTSTNLKYGHSKATNDNPLMDSENGNIGVKTDEFARGDHCHPSDTSKQDKSGFNWTKLDTTIVSGINGCNLYANEHFCYATIDVTLSNKTITKSQDYVMQQEWVKNSDYRPPHLITTVSEEGSGGREILVKLNKNGDLIARALHTSYESTSFHIVCSLFYPRFSIDNNGNVE